MKPSLFKYFTICIVILIFAANAQSQFAFGLVGGLNRSSLYIENPWENTTKVPKNGLIIGATGRYILPPNYYITGQLRYIEKGQNTEWKHFIFDYSEAQFNYLELPIHLNYNFTLNSIIPKIFGGVYFAYMTNAIARVKINGEVVDEDDSTDGFNRFDFGVDLGVGLDINVNNNGVLFFDICYSHGLVNIRNIGSTIKNRGDQISLGFIYSIKLAI